MLLSTRNKTVHEERKNQPTSRPPDYSATFSHFNILRLASAIVLQRGRR